MASNIQLRIRLFFLFCTFLAVAATRADATPVGTGTLINESQPDGSGGAYFCALTTFDNVTDDVFGTPINLGTDVGAVLCTGHFDPTTGVTAHCTSTPDPSKLTFDASGPASPGSSTPFPGQQQPFVITGANVTGTVASAIGNASYTFDGTQTMQADPNNPQQPKVLPTNDISGCSLTGFVAVFLGNTGMNAFQAVATTTGSDVPVSTSATYTNPYTNMPDTVAIDLTFSGVSTAGTTTVTATSNVAGQISSNFSLNAGGLLPTFFDVSTTAVISGPITICQHYPDANDDGIVDGTGVAAADLRVLHGEGTNPIVFVDRTVLPVDTVNKLVCASVSSLSPFVLAVNMSSTSTHDSVVLPVAPVKVTIPTTKSAVTKTLSLPVLNADLTETAGHTIQLAVTGSTCPAALLQNAQSQPVDVDFDPKTAGAQNSVVVPGGKVKVGKLPLNVRASDFTSPNTKSPARCTLALTATALTNDTVIEPNPSNNQITVDLEVIDKHDFTP